MIVGDAGIVVDRNRRGVGAQFHERREDLSVGIGDAALPLRLAGDAVVGSRDAAQQAVGWVSSRPDRRWCRRTGVVRMRGGRDRIEVGVGAAQTRQVGLIAEFAAEHRLAEDVAVIDHRMDDRNLALRVGFGKSVVVDARACRNSCGRRGRRDRAATRPRSGRSPGRWCRAGRSSGHSSGRRSDRSAGCRPSPTSICRSAQTGRWFRCCRGSSDSLAC